MLAAYINTHSADELVNKLLYLCFKTGVNSLINERLLGAFGVSTQIPFNDSDLIQFSSSMPIELKYNLKTNKYFIKKIFKDHFPRSIFDKEKVISIPGFDFSGSEPLNIMKFFIQNLKRRKIFEERYLEKVLSSKTDQNTASLLLKLCSLELWLRIFIDNPGIENENLTLEYLSR